MNYLQWLKKEVTGFKPGSLTDGLAAKLAMPLDNPGTEPMAGIRRLVVHHSATASGNASCFRVLHRGVNGWNDIGYHFVIGNGTLSADGEVEKGRELPFRGAHARGANHDSIGVCLVGNFNLGEPSCSQYSALGGLLGMLMEKYSLPVSAVTLHRLVKGSCTECPGRYLTLEKILELTGG